MSKFLEKAQRTIRAPQSMGLLDQAIVSGSNFVITWMLARKLAITDYGIYVMVIGLILGLNSVQSALIVFPFTIRYADAELLAWKAGVAKFLVIGFATAPVQIPLVAAGAFYLGHPAIALAAIPALLLWQAQELIRRAMFQRRLFHLAIFGDVVRYAIPALLIVAMPAALLSAGVAMALIACASALASMLCTPAFLRLRADDISWVHLRRDATAAWKVGRSIVLLNAFGSALSQGSVWILGNMIGLGAASQYQSVNNVMGITNPPAQGIAAVQEPAVARVYSQSGSREAIRHSLPYVAVVALIVVPVLLAFCLAPGWTLVHFYGRNSPYIKLADLLRIAALVQLLMIGFQLAGSVLNCVNRASASWRIQLFTCVGCLAVMIPAVKAAGLRGFFAALAAAYALRLLAAAGYLSAAWRTDAPAYRPAPEVVLNA